jgi:hypothetical protein
MARRTAAAIAVAWLVTIAVDFVVFGGIFAGVLEDADDPSVLDAPQLFARIPAGYASFLLEVVLLWWLLRADGRVGAVEGLRVGGLAGLLFASAVVLGLWSFTTVPAGPLALWWATVMLQLTAAGVVLGGAQTPLWPRVRTLAIVGAGAFVVTGVVLQNLS